MPPWGQLSESLGRIWTEILVSSKGSSLLKNLKNHLLVLPRKYVGMEVTSQNFQSVLPEVLSAIEEANFVAVDAEFTGLNSNRDGGNSRLCLYDSFQERYSKLADSARNFQVIQFGLCTFHYNEQEDKYTNQAYNFYVWPKPYMQGAPDPRFLCQTSSIDFLSNQSFDFNKLFRHGVSYLSPKQYAETKEKIKEKFSRRREDKKEGSKKMSLNDRDRDRMELIYKRIKTELMMQPDKQELRLEGLNSYERRLLHQTVDEWFPGSVVIRKVLEKDPSGSSPRRVILIVTRKDKDGKSDEKVLQEDEKLELDLLEEALGFTKVIRALTKSDKPLVGHHLALDLFHTIHKFVAPLPDDYVDFKALCADTFPRIFDTKLMASSYPFRDDVPSSALAHLHATLSSPSEFNLPEVTPKTPARGYQGLKERYHEAGFDAYVTGVCFIGLCNRLVKLSPDKDLKKNKLSKVTQLIEPFMNKVYVMRMADVQYFDLREEEAKPPRDHVFHVSFPQRWRHSDITAHFSPLSSSVQVSFIDDTSAFVALTDLKGQAVPSAAALVSLNKANPEVVSMPFTQYKTMKDETASGLTPMLELSSFPTHKRRMNADAPAFTPGVKRQKSVEPGTSKDIASEDRDPSQLKEIGLDSFVRSALKDGRGKKFFQEADWD